MTTIRKKRLPIALTLIGLGAVGSPAHASNWSMNASSCVPNDTAINQYLLLEAPSPTARPRPL
jgi:hypothetical protein